jgi:membrane protease YdiL (CAAX protease family)
VRSRARRLALAFLVVGVVVGLFVGGDVGAVIGVVIAMLGFQGLTRGVEGVPYVAAALFTTAGLVLVAWVHDLSMAELGLAWSTWIPGLLWSAGIVLVVGAVIGIAGGIPRTRHLFADDRITEVSGITTARRALLDIPFGTVLIEEFAFRGVLLALTIDMYGTVGGVALTSFLFGLWHISPSLEMHESHTATSGSVIPTVISTVVFTGLGGVMFAVLRLYTHSLFPPSALHWAMNGTGVVVGWFVHRNKDRAGAASSLDEDAA